MSLKGRIVPSHERHAGSRARGPRSAGPAERRRHAGWRPRDGILNIVLRSATGSSPCRLSKVKRSHERPSVRDARHRVAADHLQVVGDGDRRVIFHRDHRICRLRASGPSRDETSAGASRRGTKAGVPRCRIGGRPPPPGGGTRSASAFRLSSRMRLEDTEHERPRRSPVSSVPAQHADSLEVQGPRRLKRLGQAPGQTEWRPVPPPRTRVPRARSPSSNLDSSRPQTRGPVRQPVRTDEPGVRGSGPHVVIGSRRAPETRHGRVRNPGAGAAACDGVAPGAVSALAARGGARPGRPSA